MICSDGAGTPAVAQDVPRLNRLSMLAQSHRWAVFADGGFVADDGGRRPAERLPTGTAGWNMRWRCRLRGAFFRNCQAGILDDGRVTTMGGNGNMARCWHIGHPPRRRLAAPQTIAMDGDVDRTG